MAITIQKIGDRLLLALGDGQRYMAVPTNADMWIAQVGGGPTPGGGGLFMWPFPPNTISSRYRTTERPNHDGLDFAYAGIGDDPIPCAASGIVREAVTLHGGWGNYVRVETAGPGGEVFSHLYAHMRNPPPVSVGQSVSQGQTLGVVGDTGNSFGDHLHFEVKVNGAYVDPEQFLIEWAA